MDNRLKNALGILTALLLVVGIITAGAIAKDKIIKPVDKSRTIVMNGEGKITARPDIANVIFSVVTQGKESAAIQKTNDAKVSKVIDFLKNSSVKTEDIQTSNYSLYPQYNYSQQTQPPQISGYNASQQVTVKIRNLDRVQSIVGALTSQGVNQIDAVNYTIEKPETLKDQARKLAIDDARKKAEDLVKGLGVKLGRVVNFSEGEVSFPPFPVPLPMMREGMGGGGGLPSPVEPGTQDVSITVTVTFELK